MKVLVVALFFVFTVNAGMGQSNKGELTIVRSTDVASVLSGNRLSSCLRMLARESKVQIDKLPHIVVFQVSKRAAQAAFITQDVAVRHNTSGREGEEYYEVWLVGEPKLNYVVALENVLEDHFHLQITEKERDDVLTRVTRVEDATVEVAQGK